MKNNQVAGLGNWYEFKAREYSPRDIRFKSVDPLFAKYPNLSSYQFASLTPIHAKDLEGFEAGIPTNFIWQQAGITGNDWNAAKPILKYAAEQAVEVATPFVIALATEGAAEVIEPLLLAREAEAAAPAVDAMRVPKPAYEPEPIVENPAATKIQTQNAGTVESNAGPTEPYNRQKHYGRTPTQSDRRALGAGKNDVVDHDPSLVKRYYEGDGKGGKPGYKMTPEERKIDANDRSKMKVQPKKDSHKQGGEMKKYSQGQKQKYFGK